MKRFGFFLLRLFAALTLTSLMIAGFAYWKGGINRVTDIDTISEILAWWTVMPLAVALTLVLRGIRWFFAFESPAERRKYDLPYSEEAQEMRQSGEQSQ